MCGIIGYVGSGTEAMLIDKLKRLEYRGYDSAGMAVKNGETYRVYKAKGEIKNLEKSVVPLDGAYIGIGHTRWATHGKPDEINAHPHVSGDGNWAVVHNGIIENYTELKAELGAKGYMFYSETDTETVAKLLEYYGGNPLSAVWKTCHALKGSYALGIINSQSDAIYFAKNKSPLYVAESGGNVMIASDIICFNGFAEDYYVIPDGVYGYISKEGIGFYDELGEIKPEPIKIDLSEYKNINTYKHYMLKEIYETKSAIKNIIEYYSVPETADKLGGCRMDKIKRIKLVGCGTAYHACLLGAKMIEEKTDIECTAYVASEFRYMNPKLGDDTMVVLISQSGETADTLAAFELSKQNRAFTVAIVNVEYSTLAKQVDAYFPIKAGAEIAVASTKAYSAQLVVLNIFSEMLRAKLTGGDFSLKDAERLYENFEYGNVNDFKLLAEVLRYNDKLFMIGRGSDYYTALEAGLKIKETSYINSDTYYAGELKHGFLALIDESTYVIVFATEKSVLLKTLGNAHEARARGAKIILFTCFDLEEKLIEDFYYVIKVKDAMSSLQSVVNIVPWQIIAYYTSVNKGINPDKPRNLAKSVTVE